MTEVRAEMTASVWQVNVAVGQAVSADDALIVLESMKMEIPVEAPHGGTITALHVAAADQVTDGQVLLTID